eukprot:COSAG01_NODE_7471_length_3197_cov_6.716591_5_plen_45_part_00
MSEVEPLSIAGGACHQEWLLKMATSSTSNTRVAFGGIGPAPSGP